MRLLLSLVCTYSATFDGDKVTLRNSLFAVTKSKESAYGDIRGITSPRVWARLRGDDLCEF